MRSLALQTLFGLIAATLAAFALVFASGFYHATPPWQFDTSQFVSVVIAAVTLLAAIATCWVPIFKSQSTLGRIARPVFIGMLFCLPLFAILLILTDNGGFAGLPPLRLEKPVTAILLVAFFLLLLINALPLSKGLLVLVNALVLALFIYPVFGKDSRDSLKQLVGGENSMFDNSTKYLFGSVHDLKLTEHAIFPNRLSAAGGGLGVVDDNTVLLVTGLGKVRLVNYEDNKIELHEQELNTPYDLNKYRETSENPSRWFRVTDAVLEDTPSSTKSLFVSYHHWDEEQQCIALRLAQAEIDFTAFGEKPLDWSIRYTTNPCTQKPLYNGTGGRISFYTDNSLLLTVGESFGEWTDEELLNSDYGKILHIDRDTWESEVFTSGHRNPQGLLVDGSTIWSTEHGPHGGDELNLIVKGNDYGWPQTTYGTDYGQKFWPKSDTPGDHTVGQRPVYAWVPSIGISNVIKMKGTKFQNWSGDLIVASLLGRNYGKSLFRVKVHDERVVVTEKFKVDRPVRDLVELNTGEILLWDGLQILSVIEPSTLAFATCSGCHAVRWRTHGIGPDLMEVVGDKVARHSGFQYSEAMKQYGGRWTRDRLDRFLENPMETVPGTSMRFPGIEDPEERKAIIDYLQNLKLPPG